MTGLVKPIRNLRTRITPKALRYGDFGTQIGKSISPDPQAIPELPGAPTIDDAVKSRQDQERLRRRRGVLANIYGGASGGRPTVGTASLLGGG